MRHKMFELLLTLAVAAVVPATARAQDDTASKVEALYAEGVALYRAQKYTAAVERFEEAYRLFPEPNLQFNIGKAKEAAGDIDGAMAAYEKCASSKDATASTRTKATERMTMLRTAKMKSRVAPSESDLAPTSGAAATPTVRATTNPREPEGPGVLPWIVGGVGVALVGVGAVFFGLGASDHGKISDAKSNATNGVASLTYIEAQELADSGESKKTIGTGLVIGGVAALAGAAVLMAIGGDDSQDVAVSIAPGTDGGALVVGGRF